MVMWVTSVPRSSWTSHQSSRAALCTWHEVHCCRPPLALFESLSICISWGKRMITVAGPTELKGKYNGGGGEKKKCMWQCPLEGARAFHRRRNGSHGGHWHVITERAGWFLITLVCFLLWRLIHMWFISTFRYISFLFFSFYCLIFTLLTHIAPRLSNTQDV